MNFPNFRSKRVKQTILVSSMVIVALALSACAGMPDLSQVPFVSQFIPTPTPLPPTATPIPSPTPEPTNTPKPGETAVPATATPIPTPQVTIPQGFTPVKDTERGYSLAVPGGWTPLDLRSAQFQQMAGTFGMSGQLGPLNDFLASPQGKILGVIYMTDIANALFGGLPTLLNVTVIDAPGYTPDTAKELIDANLKANASMLGDVKIGELTTATVNGLPAVRGTASADLTKVGVKAQVYAKVVGLIANDKIYILTLGTQANQQNAKDPIFDQIIGSFRPE